MLALYFGFFAWAAAEAVRDRTPRKPFDWTRPHLEWWAAKRTRRERARTAIAMKERA